MFKRYEKIPAQLRFTFHTVDLKRHLNNDFRISFARGSYHGATDLVRPDENGVLKFESTYDTKCTLYLSKSDATTRPKKLKVILHRFSDPQTSKIYGKIIIDVARFYGSKSVSFEEIEMESGRSITPILGISIIVQQIGQSVVGTIDSADKSFIDEENVKYALSEWDQTEIDNKPLPMVKHSKKKKHQKEKGQKEHSELSSSISEESNTKSDDENIKKKKDKTHQVPLQSEAPRSEPAKKKLSDILDLDDETPQIHEINDVPDIESEQESSDSEKQAEKKPAKKVKRKKSLEKKRAAQEAVIAAADLAENESQKQLQANVEAEQQQTLPQHPQQPAAADNDNDEETKKEAKPKTLESDVGQLIKAVLARPWTSTSKTLFLDAKKKVPLPAAVFPIFAVLQHTKLFISTAVEKKKFSETLEAFFEAFEKAPLCGNVNSETRFITTLILLLLFQQNSTQLGFAPDRTQKFISRMILYLNDYARQVVTPLLINFEVLCNRFATARFEVDPLLDDFKQVLDGTKGSLNYSSGINNYLIRQFMNMLDAKMLNKLLANPARFVFSKAITWNSFLTAFQSVEKLELPMLRQAVWALVMAVNMTMDNEPGDEVRQNLCPTLDNNILVYLLKNYKPDEMMPTQIDWKKVAKSVGIDDVTTYEPVKPLNINDFETAGGKLKISLWNQITIEQNLFKLYPYLSKYSVASH